MPKILVVDDEKIISSSLCRVLSKAGHDVFVANNGVEAIRVFDEGTNFSFVFLDLLMPEIGGAEVLDFIIRKSPNTKVFMMTAYGDQLAKDDLISRGAHKVFSKPFDDITKIPEFINSMV